MSTSSNPKLTNPPVYTHRDGSVFAKIWRNESEKGGVFYNTTIGNIYTDKETGEVRETSNLSKQDLPKAVFVLNEAYRTIAQMQDLKVEKDHVQPPIVQEHSGLQAQRDAALSNVPKTPNPESGNGPAPTQIHAPEM